MNDSKSERFGIDQLKMLAGVDEHLSFLKRIQEKYEWEESVAVQMASAIREIEEKQRDENLNISIVGKFSYGKSTFINALLRINLLKSNHIQGTTTAATIMRYANEFDIKTEYKDSRRESWRKTVGRTLAIKDVKERLEELTTNNSLGKTIRRVILEAPFHALDGLVIVDTPGIESNERWHEEVTKDTIQNFSDASIVLITAEEPCPQTLTRFVRSNLSDVLTRCVFVVTKWDLVRPSQRKQVMDYIRQRIKSEFGLENPPVLPYTPLFVLAQCDTETRQEVEEYELNEQDCHQLVQESYQSETAILSFLSRQRVIVQIQKLLKLTDLIFNDMKRDMDTLRDDYQSQHQQLMQAQIKDLKIFTQAQIDKHVTRLTSKCMAEHASTQKQFSCWEDRTRELIHEQFYAVPSQGFLNSYVKSQFPTHLQEHARYEANVIAISFKNLERAFQGEMADFLDDFQKEYRALSALKGDNRKFETFSGTDIMSSSDFSLQMETLTNQQFAFQNTTMWGGMAAGALAGSVVPGIGTIVGAVAGGLAVFFMGSSIENSRKVYWPKVESAMNDFFSAYWLNIEAQFSKVIDSISNDMKAQIDKYYAAYGKLVDEMMKQDACEKVKLEEYLREMEKDSNELKNRLTEIHSIQESVRKLQ